jgi:hypothetical protein
LRTFGSPPTVEKADEDLSLLARALEDLGFGPLRDIAGNLEKSLCAGPFGMNHSFRMRSRLKCAIFSISRKSCIKTGPRGPALREFWLSPTGAPAAVVIVFRLLTFFNLRREMSQEVRRKRCR